MAVDRDPGAFARSPRTTARLRLETVTDGTALDGLGESWDALVRAMPRPSPFLLHAWVSEWWRHYAPGRELRVELAWRGDELVGALPLCISRHSGLKVAEFLGTHRSALADLLLAEEEQESVAEALAARALDGEQDLADLFGLPCDSRLARALPDASLRLIERVEAPVLDLSDGWEAVYARKTSSRTRQLHRRRRRQLSDLGRLEVRVVRSPEDVEPALRHAFDLHDLRWAARPDGSEFTTPVGKRFHLAAGRALAAAGVVRLVTLELDGRPIAFHYFFALAGRMYVHRLAFDPQYARYSPGLLNTLDAIEAAGGEGLTTVEYLGGAERYKVELSDRMDPLYQGLGLGGSIRGRAAVRSKVAAIRLRRRLKRSTALHRAYLNGLAPARRALGRMRARSGRTGGSG